ncbi:MAG: hypothetical protein VX733_07370 [Candidatus Latescibacterota bacterium]|nr:hypothetical protein [Candidatus Latescibacterota bacterium]
MAGQFLRLLHGHPALNDQVDVGQPAGVEVEPTCRRVFRDSGSFKVLVQDTGRLTRDVEQGSRRRVPLFPGIAFLVETASVSGFDKRLEAIPQAKRQRLKARFPVLRPLRVEMQTAVLEIEVIVGEIAEFIGTQAREECGFVQDPAMGWAGLQ